MHEAFTMSNFSFVGRNKVFSSEKIMKWVPPKWTTVPVMWHQHWPIHREQHRWRLWGFIWKTQHKVKKQKRKARKSDNSRTVGSLLHKEKKKKGSASQQQISVVKFSFRLDSLPVNSNFMSVCMCTHAVSVLGICMYFTMPLYSE